MERKQGRRRLNRGKGEEREGSGSELEKGMRKQKRRREA